ncbi:MAG: M1 family metallopeptidase [Bacteroidia bacterium]
MFGKKLFISAIALLFISPAVFAQKKNKKDKGEVEEIIIVKRDTVFVDKKPELPVPRKYRASNTKSNDVLHTKLEVKFDWQNSWLLGKATIDVKPYFYPVKKLYLNARGMEINKVQLVGAKGNSDLKYVYENDSIKIDLDKEYTRNDKYTVFIDYKSKPNDLKSGGSRAITDDKGLYFINPKGEDKSKMPQIWTQGETQSNSAWFPCIDSPNEKMTDEIYMTVDDKYTTLSNGLLADSKKNTDDTRTDHWKMDMPHSVYLVMMGVGEFKKVLDKPWNGKEISYYVEAAYEPYAKSIFGLTPEMIAFYSTKLGVPYAWQKYAQIVARDYVSGAMENTSATLHGEFVYQTDRELLDGSRGEDVISHELFHQWFGDLATCESWSNISLNESFATYGEYLWQEYKHGMDAADAHSYNSRQGYMGQTVQKDPPLIRFEYETREDVFDGISYNKGGQILHMLRKQVGDDAFFASLKLYLEKNRFKNTEVHDLRLAFEEVTGEDLNWFFNQWYLKGGHPILDINYSYDVAAKQVKVKVEQKQDFEDNPLYKLPVYVDLYYGDGTNKTVRREKITVTKVSEEFTFSSDTKPALINFDGEKQLLCQKSENKTAEEYVYQYKNAPKYLDRLEALNQFKDNLSNPAVYEAAKLALNDKWDGLRSKALKLFDEVDAAKLPELKPIIVKMAQADEKTHVRAEAITYLVKHYATDADVKTIYTNALTEKSYTVMGAGLNALAKENPKTAMQKAKELENENSDNIRFIIIDLYSNYGDDSNNDFFVKQKDNFTGYESIGFINVYGQFLKHCTKNETVLGGAAIIKTYTDKGKNVYVKYSAQKALKDLVRMYQDKEDELTSKLEDIKKQNGDATSVNTQLTSVTATKAKLKELYDAAKL